MTGRGDIDHTVLREISALLVDLHQRVTGPVTLDSDLRADLGLDSLATVELVDRLEAAVGATLAEATLTEARTARDLARAIRVSTEGVDAGYAAQGAAPVGTAPDVPQAGLDAVARPASFATVAAALHWHARQHPDQVTLRLLGPSPAGAAEVVTYGALLASAQRVAHALIAEGLGAGERVGIMLDTESAYFSVFAGVLLAGCSPVPLYPPTRAASIGEHLARLARLLRNAGAAMLVTLPEAAVAARLVALEVPSLRAVRTARDVLRPAAGAGGLPTPRPEDVALIQYTSGSTGDPKGVVLTHAQLLANIGAMAAAAQVTANDVVVSWLPLYHDMGLIGMWLAPLVLGIPLVAMSPLTFLARPVRWLAAISAERGSISAAPSSAYAMCSQRISDAELHGIDLAHWRLAFNGAEPVNSAALDAFVGRFAAAGFRRTAMCPAYGLAEAGVGVAFSPLGRGPRADVVSRDALARSGRAVPPAAGAGTRTVVGCGYPLPGYEIRVADRFDAGLPERHEGRVLCRGPSLSAGYFANAPASALLWRHGWLDTGDLGYLAGGELFLTGRAKDVVIKAGRNLHAEDIEDALSGVEGARRNGLAALAAPAAAGERLVLVAETDLRAPERRAALETALRRRAADALDLALDDVLLVRPGAICRSASGKIRRAATAEALARGVLDAPPPPAALQLAKLAWSQLGPAGQEGLALLGRWGFAASLWGAAVLVAVPLVAAVQLPLSPAARWSLTRRSVRMLSRMARIPIGVQGSLPPATTPAVVVANHPSFVDGAVMTLASPHPLRFVTSLDFARKPVVGSFLRRLGCVFVARDDPGRSARDVAMLADLVRGGERLCFFPEGSLAPAAGVRPFHLGAFAVSAATGCRIVPVALAGTREVLCPGSYLPRRAAVSVRIGDAGSAAAAGLAAEATRAGELRERIADLLGQPLVSW